MIKHTRTWPGICVAAAILSGCGNADLVETRREQVRGAFSGEERPGIEELRRLVPFVLENTTGPILLVERPSANQGGFFALAAERDGVQTFGSDSQESISLRGPVIVATRGLGDDLMSADIGALPELLRERRDGSFQRTFRHLDGQDQTQVQEYDCTVTVTDADVSEYCGAGRHEFVNTYKVKKGVTEQWIGDTLGVLRVTRIR